MTIFLVLMQTFFLLIRSGWGAVEEMAAAGSQGWYTERRRRLFRRV
jgi:hypothetical protein